jgi:hypothetical protein
MLQRRMEWMAAEVLRTGIGDRHRREVSDHGGRFRPRCLADRDADRATAKWDQPTTATPLDNLETWAGLVRDASGASPTDVIMAQNVWNLFRGFDDVKDLLSNQLNLSPRTSIDVGPDAPSSASPTRARSATSTSGSITTSTPTRTATPRTSCPTTIS